MATPTSSKAHAMRMKMRQHAHLQAVGITFCLILSPERRASRCCQCMSGRLQHLRCDHVNDSDSAQQETFSQCTAGQRAGGGNGLRPKCKVHWHRQPWARAGQRDCNHQLQRSQRRRPQESEAPPSSKRRRVDLCQNRKISRMRWVLGTLVGVHRFISAPMDVGRRPKTIAIEENLWTPLGTRLFNIDRTGTQCSLI